MKMFESTSKEAKTKLKEIIKRLKNDEKAILYFYDELTRRKRHVPDCTGPYGRGNGPGQGRHDGSGLRYMFNKEEND